MFTNRIRPRPQLIEQLDIGQHLSLETVLDGYAR